MPESRTYGRPFIKRGFVGVILKLMVLKRIAIGEVYSYALLKEFKQRTRHFNKGQGTPNMRGAVTKNDVYNTVNALERSGYIRVRARIEGGRLKKYYSITGEGKLALKEARGVFSNGLRMLMQVMR